MNYPIQITGKTKKQVTKLNLSNKNLAEIPQEVFQFTNLTKLVLSNNNIQSIPKDILKLKNLKTIDLANNNIKVLHSSVFKLPKLRILNLYNNNVKSLPKQFYNSTIKSLIVGHNTLTDLDFNEMRNIEELDVTYNKLKCIVVGKDALNFKILRVKGNPLESCSIDEFVIRNLKFIDIDSIQPLKAPKVTTMDNKKHIFISYSHEDSSWLKKLEKHLKGLSRYWDIDVWDDQRLRVGDNWKTEITKALNHADIAICLISASYTASDFIANNELQPILKNASEKGTTVIPVCVSASDAFEDCGLSDYQAANDPKKTLSECSEAEVERILANLMGELKSILKQ
ncbi:MAG: TIR domain-containing protein [Prevotella sp.]|nr:TIR domain-containing protein [Prevotella sp.]